MTQQTIDFKDGQFVYIKSQRQKGVIKGRTRGIPTKYLVEVITNFNKDTQERTTKLLTLDASDLDIYRDKRKQEYKQNRPLQIKIKYLNDSLERISKIEQGDWIDLRAAETVELKQGEFKLIPLGVAMELPRGFEAHVVPRSSTFKNFGIIETNSMGVVDESYKGDNDFWFFPAYALRDTAIKKGERICQFRIMKKMPKVELVEVEHLGNPDRHGHGSTGTK